MNPYLILWIVGVLILVGNIMTWRAIANAREGYEDEMGFHPINTTKK